MIHQLLLAIAWVLNRMPRAWALDLGRLLGSLLYIVLPYRKNVAWYNLSRAFPNFSPLRRRAILRSTYQHFAMVLVDFVRMPAISTERLGSIVDFDETHTREARERGGGALIMSGHLGNWELIVSALALRSYPVITVAVPQRGSGRLLVDTVRASTGSQFISKRTSTRTMLRLLRDSNFLILAGDQDARSSGVWVTLLGQPSSRPRGGAVFALQTGAPMLTGWCILHNDGRYRLSFTPVCTENLPRNRNRAAQTLTQRYMELLEEAIRRHPEQYFWFHRMWKTRPDKSHRARPEPRPKPCRRGQSERS